MKSATPLKTLRTSFLILFTLLIYIPASADPYVLDCSSGDCIAVDVNGSVLGCADENMVLYAVDPNDESIDIENSTFQWFVWVRATEENGWVEGWVTAIGGSANRFEITDNESYSYYCEVVTPLDSWATSEVYVSYALNNVSVGSPTQNNFACPGDSVSLYVTASGSHLNTQWEKKI
jgi:hypothetical protein